MAEHCKQYGLYQKLLQSTHGRSETSLNTVVHENVKAYAPVCDFFFKFP